VTDVKPIIGYVHCTILYVGLLLAFVAMISLISGYIIGHYNMYNFVLIHSVVTVKR